MKKSHPKRLQQAVKDFSAAEKRLLRVKNEWAVKEAAREFISAGKAVAPADWPFPTWSVRARPFDWQIDSQGRGVGWLDIERGEQLAEQHGWT